MHSLSTLLYFFFNDPATTEIYTLSLHDALPISPRAGTAAARRPWWRPGWTRPPARGTAPPPWRRPPPRPPDAPLPTPAGGGRSEEHTSELQSQSNLVCRLLLEKKKKKKIKIQHN